MRLPLANRQDTSSIAATSSSSRKSRSNLRTICLLLLMAVAFLIAVGQVTSYSSDRSSTTFTTIKSNTATTSAAGKKLGDGCYFVFLDVGSNLGVHGRFLLEPAKFPDAKVARDVFDAQFLPEQERDNRDFCVFAFEPNPAHKQRQMSLQSAYNSLGWRYHYIQAAVGDCPSGDESCSNNITFYHNADEAKEEFGFGMLPLQGDKSIPEVVPILRLGDWITEHIHDRSLPTKPNSNSALPPKVVMKLDIEGMEYSVLPDLMVNGVLCSTVDYVFGEIHDWTPVDISHSRGKLHLQPRQQNRQWRDNLLQIFHGARNCRTTKFDLLDDESYLHDGVPLPSSSKQRNLDAVTTDATTTTDNNDGKTAAICAIVKDEERYLEEWILYHLGLGFTQIYLYNNHPNNMQQLHDWMESQRDPGVQQGTTIHDFNSTQPNRQLLAYGDCVERFGRSQDHHHEWMAFFDPDEFLVLKQHDNVIQFLEETAPEGSVSINWVTFGTSNQTRMFSSQEEEEEERDSSTVLQPVTQRFQYCYPLGYSQVNYFHVKTIVRVEDYKGQRSPHWVFLKDDAMRRDTHGNFVVGKRQAGVNNPTFHDQGQTDVAALHHYNFKSAQEYYQKNCLRGDVFDAQFEMCQAAGGDNEDAFLNSLVRQLPSGILHDDSAWQLLQRNVPKYNILGKG